MNSELLEAHKLLALYQSMVMARAVQRRLWVHHRAGGTGAPPFLVAGSEAVEVAAAAVLRHGVDWVVPARGTLALSLAMGVTPLDVMLGLFGQAADPTSGGREEPGGFGSRRARILTTSAGPAAHVVHAAGIAYAARLRGVDELVLVVVRGRATDAGDWHEGLNFAAVHQLPVICLVEDDTGASRTMGSRDADPTDARAKGYGIAGQTLDGSDFDDALAVLGRAAERARAGDGTTLVHARLPRLSSLDAFGAVLAKEELEALASEDPIDSMRRKLLTQGLLDDAADAAIQRDCAAVALAALEQAAAADSPEAARALDNVLDAHA